MNVSDKQTKLCTWQETIYVQYKGSDTWDIKHTLYLTEPEKQREEKLAGQWQTNFATYKREFTKLDEPKSIEYFGVSL